MECIEPMIETLIMLAALATGREPPEPVEHLVDIVDDNRVYDAMDGKEVLRQLVYLDLVDGSVRIHDWRPWKAPSMVPTGRGEFKSAVWIDGETLRRVRCRSVIRSWHTRDYELDSREQFPVENRIGIGK